MKPRFAAALPGRCGPEPISFHLLWRHPQGVRQRQVQDVVAEGDGAHAIGLEIDRSGQFPPSSALGSESDEARVQRDRLVIPLPEHNGTLELVLVAVCRRAPRP